MNLTQSFPDGVQEYSLIQAKVIARGVMFAGIVWEVRGQESRVKECIMVWFAMFSCREVFVDLMEATP